MKVNIALNTHNLAEVTLISKFLLWNYIVYLILYFILQTLKSIKIINED